MSNSNNEKGAYFRSLHRAGEPLLLFNVWDAGSARTVAEAGGVALATGSWSVAAANGFSDGEQMPKALMMEVLARIAQATDLPVTVDLESGYGERLEDVADTIASSIAAGAIGCNLEDSFPATGELRTVDAAAAQRVELRRVGDLAHTAPPVLPGRPWTPAVHRGFALSPHRRAQAFTWMTRFGNDQARTWAPTVSEARCRRLHG